MTKGILKGKNFRGLGPSRRRATTFWSAAGILLAVSALAIVWLGQSSPVADSAASTTGEPNGTTDIAPGNAVTSEGTDSYLLFNQKWVEGLLTDSLDLDDVDEVFWHVFSRLPDEVVIYPSENYYYFKMYVDQRQIWGNIRLAAGRREKGVLSFAYFEYKESQFVSDPRIKRSKFFTVADGLLIDEVDPFTFVVRYDGREVTFHLHELSQEQPNLFELGEDEVSVMRTFDESGYQFFLLFNERTNYLFWVLNEEEPIPDILEPLGEDLLVGRRSGFVFLVDRAHSDRRVLAAVHGDNATVNNYYDGPFDQLADNYVEQTNVSHYLELAVPTLQGRIDKYGYYTDREGGSSRVAVSPYYVYFSVRDLEQFMERVREAEDPFYVISRRGRG